MSRKRFEDQLSQQRDAQQRELQLKEQSQARIEQVLPVAHSLTAQERRRTLEHEQQLRQQTELVRVRAEVRHYLLPRSHQQAEAQARIERENKDIRNEQLLLQAEQYRVTGVEAKHSSDVQSWRASRRQERRLAMA